MTPIQEETVPTRRQFLQRSAFGAALLLVPGFRFNVLTAQPRLGEQIVGHGDFRFRVQLGWGDVDPAQTPVNNCHEMVMDSRGRLYMVTDETRNNILIYDKSGKLLDSWGHEYPGGHGLTLWDAGGEEFLFLTDPELGKVVKTTLDGRVLLTIEHPKRVGAYAADAPFKPTETAIGPNGDIYVADGYGSQFVLQYTQQGEFIRKFGGEGDAEDQFQTVHGVTLDSREASNPTLLCTSRRHNSLKRFSLDGRFLSTISLPGAFVCRAVIDGENVYAAVLRSRALDGTPTWNSGFVTIMDRNDHVVSNPGGTQPEYHGGALQLMRQEVPILRHGHDVCLDDDGNLYVCQWNADRAYPIKLHRVA
jgi:hypothetical protein